MHNYLSTAGVDCTQETDSLYLNLIIYIMEIKDYNCTETNIDQIL